MYLYVSSIIIFLFFSKIGGNVIHDESQTCKGMYNHEEVFRRFLERYFMKQKAVKIFNLNGDSCDYLIKFLVEQKNVLTFGDDDFDIRSVFKQNFGYFTIFNTFELNSIIDVNRLSPPGPWLVLSMTKFDNQLLKAAWDQFRILHLVVVTFDTDYYVIHYYNPFTDVFYEVSMNDVDSIESIVHRIESRVRNLHGYNLRTFLTMLMPTYITPVYDKNGLFERYKGIDGDLLEGIRVGMNFKFELMRVDVDWSYIETSKKLNNWIHSREIDFIAVTHSLNSSNIVKEVYPLVPLEPTFVVCVVHTRQEKYLIDFFNGVIDRTTCILFNVTVASLVFALFLIKYSFNRAHAFQNFFKSFLEISGMTYGISLPLSKYTQSSIRLVIASAFIISITTLSIVQASIYRDLNVQSDTSQVNTIEDLIQQNFSIYTYEQFKNVLNILGNGTKTDMSVKKQIIVINDIFYSETLEKLKNEHVESKIGMLFFKYEAMHLRAYFLDKRSNAATLHIVQEPIFSTYMSFHLPSWSPFLEIMDEMCLRALEVGLRQKGFDEANFIIHLEEIRTIKKLNLEMKGKRPKQITLENMYNIFEAYCIYVMSASVIFIIELVFYRVQKLISSRTKRR